MRITSLKAGYEVGRARSIVRQCGKKLSDALPELFPLAALLLREVPERTVPHWGEVGVRLPDLEPAPRRGALGRRADRLPKHVEVGAEPVQRLLPRFGAFLLAEFGR